MFGDKETRGQGDKERVGEWASRRVDEWTGGGVGGVLTRQPANPPTRLPAHSPTRPLAHSPTRLVSLSLSFWLCIFVTSTFGAQDVSISGKLLMLDGKTPHVAIVVQVVPPPNPLEELLGAVATTLSDEEGQYQFFGIKPGRYRLRCYTLKGYVYYKKGYEAGKSGQMETEEQSAEGEVLVVEREKPLTNIDFHIAPFKTGFWRNNTPLDGLVHNTVNALYIDSHGMVWVATGGGGISRYDGRTFVNFTQKDGLAHGSVVAIEGEPDGTLWFGTFGGGVSRYDGKTFQNFTIEDGLPSHFVSAIRRELDGTLWFGTSQGVARYDGKTFQNFAVDDGLASNQVNVIGRSSDGMMWFGTDRGISRYDGETFQNFTVKDGLPANRVNAIYSDKNGIMWFGTSGYFAGRGGVSRYDGKTFTHFTVEDGLVHHRVYTIHGDTSGVIWIGTWGGGISRYDGVEFVNFTTHDGLLSNTVKHIYFDAGGLMWVGTGSILAPSERGGISRYDADGFVTYSIKDGLAHNDVRVIYRASGGDLWIGTYGGVSVYDGKWFMNLTTKDGLVYNVVNDIHQDVDGNLWFATGRLLPQAGGISRYDGEQFVNFGTEDGLPARCIRAIHQGPDKTLWFATLGGGASRYDGEQFVNFSTEDGLPSNQIYAIHGGHDGLLWFGTAGQNRNRRIALTDTAGVSRYDGERFVNFSTEDGLPSNQIGSIFTDVDDTIWFGTWQSGVSHYDGKRFVNFTTDDGLAHNMIRSIHRDSKGIIWFGTDARGVSGYDGVAWTSLDGRDGLAGDTVMTIAEDEDSSLWFGTLAGGFTRYRRSPSRPKVQIISMTTDQTVVRFGPNFNFDAVPPIAVGTRVTFGYNAIDFKTIPEKRQYRVRIEEIDTPTKVDFFDYTFTKPGSYTFSVQAIDRDLNYSEPARLILSVVLPFYLQAAFLVPTIGGGTLVLIGFIVYGVRYYTQRRYAQQIREQMLSTERQKNAELAHAYSQIQSANARLEAQNVALIDSQNRIEAASVELRRTQAQLVESEKMAALGGMVTGIAHEINTPMGVGVTIASSLESETQAFAALVDTGRIKRSDLQEFLSVTRESSNLLLKNLNRAVELIQSFKQVAVDQESEEKRTFVLKAYLNEILIHLMPKLKRTKHQIDIRCNDVLTLESYPGAWSQVVTNLVMNSIIHAYDNDQAGRITFDIKSQDGQIFFQYADDGKGIPPDDLPQIFDPFFTTKRGQGGSGLGLHIVYNLVTQKLNGSIRCESEVGCGTRFIIVLPPTARIMRHVMLET